jgi:hypothetical protein
MREKLLAAAPEVKTQDGISYFSGGVGEDERQELAAAAQGFNLKVVTALRSGDYLLETVLEGPWLFVKLEPARYRVEAEAAGKVLHKTISVRGKGQQIVVFHWPEQRWRGLQQPRLRVDCRAGDGIPPSTAPQG